ncbi:hypothetical protein [Corynebacterium pacaense]|uniref:hypothetical protein n=1 Tax=Corynebacterium pacaense TaxID=1816684 RepID=UPI0009B9D857|nr:hypothetical protein [Corynebacterium pacaense]
MSASSGKSRSKSGERAGWRRVPAGIRIGGAFVALGAVLLVFAAIELFTGGFMRLFGITAGFLLILVAALILGGFATTSKYEESSRIQVISLLIAVVLVILSRLLPNTVLMWVGQFWLSAWAVVAILCGLFIRRALLPK